MSVYQSAPSYPGPETFRIEPVEYTPPATPEVLGSGVYQMFTAPENPYHAYFAQLDMMAPQIVAQEMARRWAEEAEAYGSDTEVFRSFWETMQDHFDQSDIIKKFRSSDFVPSEHDFQAYFREFDRARKYAFEKVPMSAEQRRKLHDTIAETSQDVRHIALNGAEAAGDFFVMADAGAKKIKYMDSKRLLGALKKSGSLTDTETMQRHIQQDLAAMDEYADLPAVKDVATHLPPSHQAH